MGLFSLGKRSPNSDLTAADRYLGRIIKKVEPDFCRDSDQKDLRETKEILVGQKEKTIFLESKWWLSAGTGCPERMKNLYSLKFP